MSIPSERKVTLESGLNNVIYTVPEGKKIEYVPDDIELYYKIGTLDQIRDMSRGRGGGNNIFSKDDIRLGTVEQLKNALHVKVQQGGARKSLRKRKNKKSRKGKSKKNRRKSNRRR